MCISSPKVETPAAPPTVEEMDTTQNVVAARESDIRRRQRALSRTSTMAGGAMQGAEAGTGAPAKTRLGQ